ncbi:hypothetical protein V8F06_014334 [Rhypophila decipiens]
MAELFGVAAAAISLLTVAKECLSIFQEFQLHTPESHRVLRFRLEAEAIRFKEWCDILGVQDVIAVTNSPDSGWHESREMAEFQNRLRSLLRFDNERVAAMTIQALQDIFFAFRKAQAKLMSVSVSGTTNTTSESGVAEHGYGSAIKKMFRPRRSSPVTNAVLPSASTLEIQHPYRAQPNQEVSFSKASTMYANVRWVALDKKSFKSLLEDISAINTCLATFLADDAKARVSRRVQTDILQMPELRTGEVVDILPQQPEVQNMVKVANTIRITEREIGDGSSEVTNSPINNASPTGLVLSVADFDGGSLSGLDASRVLASLGGRPVLVEWTHYGKSISLDHLYRRGNLVRLLKDTGLYRKFGTMPSAGIVTDTRNSRVGLVFEIPTETLRKQGPVIEKSLLDILVESPGPLPLDQRFAIAKKLALATHNLQSVGWLHKSIRSDNLVCFQSGAGKEEADFDLAQECSTQEMYLMGWYLSRPDQPSELSQTVSISTQSYKLSKQMIELYHHPEVLHSQGQQVVSRQKRPRFKLEYDIYSFGLVLLEIGLWKPLSFLRQRCSSDEEFREKVAGPYCDMLRSSMGAIYWRATKRCLLGRFDRSAGPGTVMTVDHAEGISLPMAFERQVVSELERCVA